MFENILQEIIWYHLESGVFYSQPVEHTFVQVRITSEVSYEILGDRETVNDWILTQYHQYCSMTISV